MNTPLPKVKTATIGLSHCTNQSSMGQAVPKLGDMEAGRISHGSHVCSQHCPWRRKILSGNPQHTPAQILLASHGGGNEDLQWAQNTHDSLQGMRDRVQEGRLPWAYWSDWHTLWDPDNWQQWDGFCRGTDIDVTLSRSLNSFTKCNIPPESFPPTWYLLGMSPG